MCRWFDSGPSHLSFNLLISTLKMYSAPTSILFILLLILSSCTENEENTTSEELNIDTTLVGKHGRLEVKGNQIVDKHGNPMSLAGNSFFWSNDNWGGERYYKT